jgi:hypothetical protein
VSSIASHCALQYLPDFDVQVQGGCAHFLALSAAMVSPGSGISIYGVALLRTKWRMSEMTAKIRSKWIIAEAT